MKWKSPNLKNWLSMNNKHFCISHFFLLYVPASSWWLLSDLLDPVFISIQFAAARNQLILDMICCVNSTVTTMNLMQAVITVSVLLFYSSLVGGGHVLVRRQEPLSKDLDVNIGTQCILNQRTYKSGYIYFTPMPNCFDFWFSGQPSKMVAMIAYAKMAWLPAGSFDASLMAVCMTSTRRARRHLRMDANLKVV